MSAREEVVNQREELLRLREGALRAKSEAEAARLERERLLVQMREANERLVIQTVRADELAEEAIAARVIAARSAAVEAEGRRRAEALAEQLRASEGAFRASEAQFQTLANMIPMIAWYADSDGDITWHNHRWYEYTGTPLDAQAGWQWQSVYDPEDLPRIVDRRRVAFASGAPWEDVFRLRGRDGEFRWFLSRAFPIRDAAGHIVRWFGTNVDVDDQKRAEARGQENDRAKGEFLAMLGHELRTPMELILGILDVMTGRAPSAFTRQHTIIQRHLKHLIHLVDDLLEVSRAPGWKIQLRREPIELADAVAFAVEMVGLLIETKGHILTVNVATRGLAIDGDLIRLGHAIGNILANAAKYTPPGGSIDVIGERRRSSVSLCIRDTGIGISKEMLPHVFDMLGHERQELDEAVDLPLDLPLDRSQDGLGLGLAVVRRLVAMYGGTVTAWSEGVGRGSEFEIVLPASV